MTMLRSHNALNVEQSSESRRITSFLYFRYVDSHWKMIINVRDNRVFVINSKQRILHTVLWPGVRGPAIILPSIGQNLHELHPIS